MIPDRAAEEINKALQTGDEGWAFNLVIQARDHLAEMLDSNDRGSDSWLLRSRRRVADPRYETLLVALVEHEFDKRSRQPKPDWVKGPRMDPAWVHANARWGAEWTRQHTPEWLAQRGVFLSDRDLMTA